MKKFAMDNKHIKDRPDERNPPRNKNVRLSAKYATAEKQTKIHKVPRKAVTMILGSISRTLKIKGPIETPIKKPNIPKIASLRGMFSFVGETQNTAIKEIIMAIIERKPAIWYNTSTYAPREATRRVPPKVR